jgi:diguanylate cyclase (GGDEF)-like protein
VTTELTFILVTGGVASLVGVGALVAVLRERAGPGPSELGTRLPGNGSEVAPLAPSHEAVVRVVWWVAIAGVLVGIGLADPYPANREAIYALGGAAALLVVVMHELLPRRWRGRTSVAFEVLAALALASGLVWLTGRAASPFVFTYHLVVVAAALTMGSRLSLLVAVAASLAYLGQLAADSSFSASSADLLRVGINLGSLWLLAYLAGVYAAAERRVRARVLELSRTDPLTGLFNRGQLFATLEQEVQRTRRSGRGFCVLMIDVDGLKAINDSAGHLRGDEVLRSVGRVILGSVRGVDSAYRYGGDEFLIMLPETDFIGAYVVAEKIREGVEEVSESLGTEATTSVSIGLVSYPEDGSSSEELMTAADRAMYQAKSLGKNQISGNPRPRRIPQRRPAVMPDEVIPPTVVPASAPTTPSAPPAPSSTSRPSSAPFPVRPAAINRSSSSQESHGEDEPDPADVRRQIAAARRNMDPDHQIRRAMDAFLSSPSAQSSDPT